MTFGSVVTELVALDLLVPGSFVFDWYDLIHSDATTGVAELVVNSVVEGSAVLLGSQVKLGSPPVVLGFSVKLDRLMEL